MKTNRIDEIVKEPLSNYDLDKLLKDINKNSKINIFNMEEVISNYKSFDKILDKKYTISIFI